jgi:hypothetical protein
MNVTIQKAEPAAYFEQTRRVIDFSECSYYNGSKPANLSEKNFQLRYAKAGGDGYRLFSEHSTEAEAIAAHQRAPNIPFCTWSIFDCSNVIRA